MASKLKQGKYGMTRPKVATTMGTVVVCNKTFDNIEGEIINKRNDYYKYLTVQIPSEYPGRVYILNLLETQCKDIKWKEEYSYNDRNI